METRIHVMAIIILVVVEERLSLNLVSIILVIMGLMEIISKKATIL